MSFLNKFGIGGTGVGSRDAGHAPANGKPRPSAVTTVASAGSPRAPEQHVAAQRPERVFAATAWVGELCWIWAPPGRLPLTSSSNGAFAFRPRIFSADGKAFWTRMRPGCVRIPTPVKLWI